MRQFDRESFADIIAELTENGVGDKRYSNGRWREIAQHVFIITKSSEHKEIGEWLKDTDANFERFNWTSIGQCVFVEAIDDTAAVHFKMRWA